MKIDKSTNSKWGAFKLIATKGWKISQQFIDFESKLLWVSESLIDTSDVKPDKYGTKFIPTNSYVIDIYEARILPEEEWRKKFDYSIKEYLIGGTDFKLVEERKPMPNINQDAIEDKLINLKDGRIHEQGRGIAFREKKRKNAYERYVERKENEKRRLDKAKSQLSLEHFYHDNFLKLGIDDTILTYSDKNNFAYKVKVSNQGKIYVQKGGEIPEDYKQRTMIRYSKISEYSSIGEFWRAFASDKYWFEIYRPFTDSHIKKLDNNILAYYVIHEGNSIRNSSMIDWRKYKGIREWENLFDLKNMNSSEIIQVCPNCMSKVRFYPRYPAYICRNCVSQLTDKNGRMVAYYNTSISGGCEGKYVNSDEEYDSPICYIGEKKFYATDARFGGIVVQLESGINRII